LDAGQLRAPQLAPPGTQFAHNNAAVALATAGGSHSGVSPFAVASPIGVIHVPELTGMDKPVGKYRVEQASSDIGAA
jgi:hypothetical protein